MGKHKPNRILSNLLNTGFPSFLLVTLVLPMFLFSSCTDDNITDQLPTLEVMAVTGLGTTGNSIGSGSIFKLNVIANKGTHPLKTLALEENGNIIVKERIAIDGVNIVGNPITLSQTNNTNLDFIVSIKAHQEIAVRTYTFIITDEAGNATKKTIDIQTVGTAPTIQTPGISSQIKTVPGGIFGVVFNVVNGSTPLQNVTFFINDIKATDNANIFYGQNTVSITSNPFPIPTSDKENLSREIYFKAPEATGMYKYTVRFNDESGLSTSRDINVSVGTEVFNISAVLLNQAGGTGQGALDLDTGASTGTNPSNPSSATAEIRDEGNTEGNSNMEWKQQISGINGSIVRYIKKGLNGVSQNLNFNEIKYKEEIKELWERGAAFNNKSTDLLRDVSDKLVSGDILSVKNGDKYYLMVVKDIKVTPNDNKDQYSFEIKY